MHFLGIDGGGSHTRALICDQSGKILGKGESGPSNPMSIPVADCQAHLEEAIQLALAAFIPDTIEAAHFGIAGAQSKEGRNILQGIAGELLDCSKTKLSIGSDLEIALEGGLAGAPGIALIAGTGSACYGKNGLGAEAFCGGWGDLVDDAGSGNWIGLQALQVCVRQADGRLTRSELQNRVLEYLGIDSMDDFKQRIHQEGLSRKERAELAPIIFDLAENGDPAAVEIVDQAADQLFHLLHSCCRQLHFASPDIVLLGGLSSQPQLHEQIVARITNNIPEAQVHRPKLSATSGAILKAMRASGIEISALTLGEFENLA